MIIFICQRSGVFFPLSFVGFKIPVLRLGLFFSAGLAIKFFPNSFQGIYLHDEHFISVGIIFKLKKDKRRQVLLHFKGNFLIRISDFEKF